jgi:hypothetical protein
VLRRPLVVLGAALVALSLASPALAIRAHVRIEGATATIFGATEPLVTPKVGMIHPPDGPDVTVTFPSALGGLEAASRLGEFYYQVESTSFGPYVSQIGRYGAGATTGWVFKVNGASPPVGFSVARLKAGDRLLVYFIRFGSGPPTKTLFLKASAGCYRALAEDENGHTTVAKGVTFRINSRRVASASGRFCPTGRWSTLRATKPGLIRSQVVTHRAG